MVGTFSANDCPATVLIETQYLKNKHYLLEIWVWWYTFIGPAALWRLRQEDFVNTRVCDHPGWQGYDGLKKHGCKLRGGGGTCL